MPQRDKGYFKRKVVKVVLPVLVDGQGSRIRYVNDTSLGVDEGFVYWDPDGTVAELDIEDLLGNIDVHDQADALRELAWLMEETLRIQ